LLSNLGGAVYKGIEAQGTYAFDEGIAVFANGSLNSAKTKDTRTQIAKAPKWTAAAGLIVKRGPFVVSLIDKIVGTQWSVNGEPAIYKVDPYNTTDLTVTWSLSEQFKLIGGVYNAFNSRKITALAQQGGTIAFDQYYFQGGRAFQVTAKFGL
jgi:iron complex outermembrane receptor protein